MYLSKVVPYAQREYSRLIDHRLIMRGFPFSEGNPRQEFNVLFRIEPDGVALVQSAVRPDWSNCLPPDNFQTRMFELPSLTVGRHLRFRMAFNSIARLKGKELRIDPTQWIERHNIGANLDVRSIECDIQYDVSSGNRIAIHRAICDGICTVTDADVMQTSIIYGVGRAKAYGCGLFSVCRFG
jgi:CRISPR system Cascade subunit CasE